MTIKIITIVLAILTVGNFGHAEAGICLGDCKPLVESPLSQTALRSMSQFSELANSFSQHSSPQTVIRDLNSPVVMIEMKVDGKPAFSFGGIYTSESKILAVGHFGKFHPASGSKISFVAYPQIKNGEVDKTFGLELQLKNNPFSSEVKNGEVIELPDMALFEDPTMFGKKVGVVKFQPATNDDLNELEITSVGYPDHKVRGQDGNQLVASPECKMTKVFKDVVYTNCVSAEGGSGGALIGLKMPNRLVSFGMQFGSVRCQSPSGETNCAVAISGRTVINFLAKYSEKANPTTHAD